MTADVKIFARNLEERAQEQIGRLAATPAFDGARIRIMPDAHAGAGCVIGFTANLGERVVPNLVGVDIGCGMLACRLAEPVRDLAAFDQAVKAHIPTGFAVNRNETCNTAALGLIAFSRLKKVDHLDRSLGSLGGGNHFIEIDTDDEGCSWLVIHCGSRNLGQQIATLYQKRAEATCADDVPRELAYLEEDAAQAYLHDMRICQTWATRNRERIAETIERATGCTVDGAFHTVHNYIGDDGFVRKGAISARTGEQVLIPLNMRDGAVIGLGKGNEDWNFSAPHGAGRALSRTAARDMLDVEAFVDDMRASGIYTTTACAATVDEAPGAYKPPREVLDLMAPTVDIVRRLRPVYNLKATDAIEARRRERREKRGR